MRVKEARLLWLGEATTGRRHAHLDPLVSHELLTGTSVLSAAPIPPEKRRKTNRERMQQHADLARLCGSVAIPLALLAQRTGTATADAGSIHHAQASIGLSALLMGAKLLVQLDSAASHRAGARKS